ncbi:DUF4115 domain-containing protein [Pseudofrankia sp. BMG5.36]|uniref:DUF4115 domain-containing protein n=1 Tax=Pseudofrankia sp. BMG5.36 TaxID=1834512 RepID=UPI0008D9FEF9|nr:DUF4115 domain-containing protein [Pseudofrankia sp. BMG5.36]OHV43445.1 hypothetical protein BCD48_28140 [Pseudofrankia sp. BMG5.36]
MSDASGTDSAVTRPTPTPSASASPAPPPAEVVVRLEARDAKSWLEVWDDSEKVLLQLLLQQGESRVVTSEGALQIKVGNAGAVYLSCNGKNLGALGAPGKVATIRVVAVATGGCTAG